MSISSKKLAENALKLELQVVTQQLLRSLFPENEPDAARLGRYRIFGRMIEQAPKLKQALLDKQPRLVESEWQQLLKAKQSDARFLHALALLYWEAAQAKQARQQSADREWTLSTALLVLLLSSEEFWEYFSQDRWTTEQDERVPLDSQQQETLQRATLENILSVHSTYGKQYFSAGIYNLAKVHVQCLNMCRAVAKLRAMLQTQSIPYALAEDEDRLQALSAQADKILDEWCTALVREGEQAANDPDAIKALAEGIRKDYQKGMHVLEPFMAMNIPVVRVLRTALAWYNDWCGDVNKLEDTEQLIRLVKAASTVADQLAPLCDKTQPYHQENQLLSEHYTFRGLAFSHEKKSEESKKAYALALEWNSANAAAERLLEQSTVVAYLTPAIEHIEKGELDKALALLKEAEQQVKDQDTLNVLRSVIYFRIGQYLAGEGKLREALTYARLAYQHEPNQEAIQKFVKDLEELAPEEDNIRLIKQAEEALKNDKPDQAIQYASRVPKNSKRYAYATELQSYAYFGRGVDGANNGNFAKAEADLRKSLQLCDDAEFRKRIIGQLSVLLNAQANQMAGELKDRPASSRSDLVNRVNAMKKLLEEAIKLDPNNTSARENLKVLNELGS